MKLKLKNRLSFIIIVTIITLISINYIIKFNDFNEVLTNAEKLREQYEYFLKNSPFKKTLSLTKKERIGQGLPPNKYYEREWELTMNPATGKPEPNKIFALQKKLKDKSLSKRNPGDAVDNAWVDRGPNNVGGRTRVVLFDPNDPNNQRVYAGGVSGGLWVNPDITNASSTWTQVSGVPGNMNISCITVDPNDSNTWYIGTGEQYTFGAAVGNGVYKTIDGGANWVNVPIQLNDGGTVGTDFSGVYYINDIIAWNHVNWDGLGNNRTEIFVGVGTHLYGDAANPQNWLGYQTAGLYKSIDDGSNWSRLQSASLKLTPTSSYYTIPNDFEVSADNTLWFGSIRTPGSSNGGGKVFNSIDGTTWTLKTTLTTSDRVELAVSASNANKIYALTQGDDGTNNSPPHIFVTTDAFATTTELAKPDDADLDISAADFTRNQAFYDLVIEVDPTDDTIVYVGGIDLFRTTLGENTNVATNWEQISRWTSLNPNLDGLTCSVVHADQHAFAFRPGSGGNNEAVIGGDGGVYYASSLSTAETNDVFTAMNTDYNVTQFYYGGYGQDTANELILAGAQDNGSQFINGASAGANSSTRVFGGDGAYSTIDKDGNYMVVSYVYNTHVYFNLPYNGTGYYIENWQDVGTNKEGDFINPAGLDHNLNIMYSNGTNTTTGAKQINRYILGSASATKSQLTNALLTGSPTAFKVSPYTTASTTLLVGTDDSKLLKLTNAEATPTWTDISGGSFVGSISAIEFGATENDIFVTFHNYGVTSVWYSADGGTTWENKEGDLPDMPVKCILQNPLVLNEVIIGTELGVWSTVNFNDVSPTWVSSYNGMQDVKVVDLDLRTVDNSILATTFGRGVFTGKFTATDFTITTANSTITTCTPNDAVFNFDFNANASYNTVTNFSVTAGAPAGASITFNPTSLSAAGTFTMTVGNIGSVAIGDYTITVTGTGNQTNSINVILKVRDTSIGTVTTVAPVNEATGIAISNLVFDWNADASATSYDIDIATDAGFSTIIETANVATNSYTGTSNLNNSTVYYWRVRAKNNCVIGSYSETQKFQTAIASCNTLTNNTSVDITDGTGVNTAGAAVESVITFNDNITISDINVTIDISHTYIQDLVISIIAPDATEIILFNRECNGENDILVTYDDAAATTITCASPVSGTYIPANSLSGFNGIVPSVGDWTLKVVDWYAGDTGTINSWSIEICQNQTTTNSTFTNTPLTVGTSPYILQQAETEATSAGSTASEQIFMLAELPTKGDVKLNNVTLALGETFTQADINAGTVTYANTSGINDTDFFKVDITNATNGFLPNQQINITIDATLGIDNYFFEKTGISVYPTVSEGNFTISSSKMLGTTTIEIYSMTGQKVFVDQLNFSSGVIERINATNLSSGIYIIKLTTETLQGSKKIIIK